MTFYEIEIYISYTWAINNISMFDPVFTIKRVQSYNFDILIIKVRGL